MSETWVLNASPLILFSRIDRLDIFERLTTNVIVPKAVQHEVRAGELHDASAAAALTWAEARHAPDIVVPTSVEHWDLGPVSPRSSPTVSRDREQSFSTTGLHGAVPRHTRCA